MDKNFPINAVIRTLLLLDRARIDQAERPPLELTFVLAGQHGGFVWRGRFAHGDDFNFGAIGVAQTAFDQRRGELGYVNANPLAAQLFGRVNCHAAAAEGIENPVAWITTRLNEALQQGDGLLRWIAETF